MRPAGLLTVEEVADELSVSQETVRRWVRSGKLPCIRDRIHRGAPILIAREELAAYLEARMAS